MACRAKGLNETNTQISRTATRTCFFMFNMFLFYFIRLFMFKTFSSHFPTPLKNICFSMDNLSWTQLGTFDAKMWTDVSLKESLRPCLYKPFQSHLIPNFGVVRLQYENLFYPSKEMHGSTRYVHY